MPGSCNAGSATWFLALAAAALSVVAQAIELAAMESLIPIHQLCESDLPDLHDGTIEDWRTVFSAPTLTERDFISHPEAGDGAIIGAPDLAVNVYLGWYEPDNQLYVAVERWDDVYVNTYVGSFPASGVWGSDNVEIMVDGDHSGGQYQFDEHAFETIGLDWRDMVQRQAQRYIATAWSVDQVLLAYDGYDVPEAQWVVRPPFADAEGMIDDGAVHYSAIELRLTPFDTLRWDSPSRSIVGRLYAGKVIGLNIALPDFDSANGDLHGYHSLSPDRITYMDASTFVDGLLIGRNCSNTIVRSESWGRIKAALRLNQSGKR